MRIGWWLTNASNHFWSRQAHEASARYVRLGDAAKEIRNAGHDTVWAGDWSEDPGDDEILARARNEGRTLVTLDKDFGELAIVFAKPHCGIVRLVNFRARQQATVCLQVLTEHGTELESVAIVTAMPGRLRIRPASGDEEAG